MAGQSTRMLVDTYEELSYLSTCLSCVKPVCIRISNTGESARRMGDEFLFQELADSDPFVESLPINRIDHLQSIICDIIQPIEDMLDSNGWDTEQLKKNGLDKTRTN